LYHVLVVLMCHSPIVQTLVGWFGRVAQSNAQVSSISVGNMKVFSSMLLVDAAMADLAITWSDCGAKHATTTDVQPTSLPLGAATAITGTGAVDEDITGGTYDMELKAGGGLIDSHFKGNNCEAKSFDLPLGLGKLNWDGVSCPLKAGTAKIGFHVTLASALPPALATSDITLHAGDQNSETLLCVKLHLQSTVESTAGACSADEQGKLSDSATVGKAGSDCGLSAYNVLTGAFNHDKFNSCFTDKLQIGSGCSECYATNGEYAAKNCKAACLLGWCKQGCLDCSTADAPKSALDACTGFTSGSADPCMEDLKATAGASCTSDDQAAVKAMDDNDFGDLSNTCGTKNYNILTGKLNHDGFKTCLTAGVAMSDSCADCYVATAEYGASNCKAACLLGWCKQGCRHCTAPAQTTLATCTGFPTGSPKPCLKATAGACSADDQGKLSDGATVGKAGSDCGLSAYNVLTGAFNHDKFNSCFTDKLQIASGCSECYATNGEYAAKNCKAACLLGWCKQGCLDCSTADAPKSALDACTGFTSGSADPCMEDITV